MEKLAREKRAAILSCLIEGNSLASTSRITGCAPNSVVKVMCEAGEACLMFQDKTLVNLPSTHIQLDEIWSFVGCKEQRKKSAKSSHPGDIWTWTAICADTKVIPAWYVGDRSGASAYSFCHDLKGRFASTPQITSDGHNAYPWAVRGNFGEGVDFAQLVKIYAKGADGRDYVTRVEKMRVSGNPDMDEVSTSYVERSNLMIRMTNRRFTRLTNAYSKKLENHAHMIAIGFMGHNFCRKHEALQGRTPAMAAGVADHRWSMDEVVAMVEQYHQEKLEAQFEAGIAQRWQKPRTSPKTYKPTPKDKIPTPWYLQGDSEKGLTD